MTDLRQAITDTAQAIAKASEWRSMDSAPKDGTRFLFWLADIDGPVVAYFDRNGALLISWDNEDMSLGISEGFWLPLPPPPAREDV